MNIAVWIVVFLLLVIHLLRHMVIGKENKLVFWLSVAFAVTFVSSATILFDHHYGDWPASGQVKLLVMVIVYVVIDQLFANMVSQLADQVEKEKVEAAVSTYGNRRAEEIVNARDRQAFQALLDDKLEIQAEAKATALVHSRDADEFSRLRQEQLDRLVQQEFEKRLQAAIEAGARAEITERLQQEMSKVRQSGNEGALWVALQGTGKTVAEAFGLETPQANKVFAVPYWVFYDPINHKPRPIRCNSTTAQLVEAGQTSFVSNRWSKVEGTNQIVLDGAIISRPS